MLVYLLCRTKLLNAINSREISMYSEESCHERSSALESKSVITEVRTSKKKTSDKRIDYIGVIVALASLLLVIIFLGPSAKFLGFAIFSIIIGLSYYFSTGNYRYAIAWIAGGFLILLCYIGSQLL
jgi:hypothetical protein